MESSGYFDKDGAYVFAVVGIKHGNRQHYIDLFNKNHDKRKKGTQDDYFSIIREPNNEVDPNACAVWIRGGMCGKIGYIRAKDLAPLVGFFEKNPQMKTRMKAEPIVDPIPEGDFILMKTRDLVPAVQTSSPEAAVNGSYPFVYIPSSDQTRALGVLTACINEVGKNHAKKGTGEGPVISEKIGLLFPELAETDTATYVQQLLINLALCYPKQDKATERLMTRIEELTAQASTLKHMDKQELERMNTFAKKATLAFKNGKQITVLEMHRKRAGMSRTQLADTVGISSRQLAYYEAVPGSTLGKARPFVLNALAEALGLAAEDLVKDGDAQFVAANG